MPFDQLVPRSYTASGIKMYAPTASGVYGISNAREWIYIGVADNIQDSLAAHLQDVHTYLMKREPKGFAFEVCFGSQRSARQDRLVLEYKPICNQQFDAAWVTALDERCG